MLENLSSRFALVCITYGWEYKLYPMSSGHNAHVNRLLPHHFRRFIRIIVLVAVRLSCHIFQTTPFAAISKKRPNEYGTTRRFNVLAKGVVTYYNVYCLSISMPSGIMSFQTRVLCVTIHVKWHLQKRPTVNGCLLTTLSAICIKP